MSSVNPIKFLNRGPEYLRTAFQPNKGQKPQLSAAERLNIQRKSKSEQSHNSPTGCKRGSTRERPQTAPVKPQRSSELETCTAENLLNRNGDSKGPGYAARMLNAGNLTRDPADPLKRPNTAQPYSLHQQKRRLPVSEHSDALKSFEAERLESLAVLLTASIKGNHNILWPVPDVPTETTRRPRSRSSSVDKFFDTLGGTMVPRSYPGSLVPSGSVSDLSGLSRAASQNVRSVSSSTLDDCGEKLAPLKKEGQTEVSQVEKRIRVMMWLSKCKPQPHFSTPVKG